MEQSVKKKFYSIAFIICLAILLSSFPFSFFIKNQYLSLLLSIVFKIFSLIVILIYTNKNNLEKPKLSKINKSILVYLPFLIVCLGNLYLCLIGDVDKSFYVDYKLFILSIITCLFTCIIEELLFRSILTTEIVKYKSKSKAILISSAIFGLIHLLNISSISTILPSLLQVIYTFGLGLILSSMYLESKNIILPIVFHFLFNLLNDILVNTFFYLEWNLPFFIINISFSILAIVYSLFIYNIKRKKE